MSTDSITLYGVRPPELFFINNPVDYLVWFSRCELVTKEQLEKFIVEDISLCHWIDGTNHRIRIRYPAISKVVMFMQNNNKMNLPIYIFFK